MNYNIKHKDLWTPLTKFAIFSLHSQHEMQNYTQTISNSLFYRML